MLLLLVRFCNFYFSMLEQQCPAKVLRRKTKTDEVKCGLTSCSALNIPVVTMKIIMVMAMMSKEQLTL